MDITLNPFEVFGLTPTFTIDEQHLSATFRSLQRAVHPDRYAAAPDQERRWALEKSAAVNDAYHILRDPVRRARCLLALQGVDTLEDSNTITDPIFLMEQLELRERLDEVRAADHPRQMLSEIKKTLQERRITLLSELQEYLRIDTQESLAQAAEIVGRLHFFNRLGDDVYILEERYLELTSTS